MNDTKFTKGPWRVDVEFGQIWNVSSVDGVPIALASATASIASDLKQVERTANAALIAASPTMYQSLKEALECLADVAANKGGWDWEAVLQDGEEALKKARGES